MSNSSPVLAGLITNVMFEEQLVNGAAQRLDTNVEFTDVDGNFSAGTLVVSGLLPEDTVGIRNEGTAAGQIAVTGSNIRFDNVIFGSFTGGTAGNPLVVTFNASATSAAIDALIQNLTYANSSNTPTASRNLVITISDAAGAAAIPPTSFSEVTGLANPFDGVNVGGLSIPTFADLDGDGDLDALIGEQGGTLRYYRNTGTALAPVFTEQVGAANPFNGVNAGSISTPTFADLDGDGDLDAMIGESDGFLNYYRNTGTALAPVFTLQTGAANPFNGVNVGISSAPIFADLDGDGDLDAVIGESDGILNYYRNTGTAAAPVFSVQVGAANPFNAIDVGFSSNPSFADLDGDGDLDAVIGESDGILNYFRNTGTALAPVFTLQTGAANPFNDVDVGARSTPTFADLDGDGDLDALIGETDGVLNYYRNTRPAAPTPGFTEQTGAANPFNGIDVGSYSKPAFADLDGDGDLDVLIGENDGTLNYYRNTGTALVPVFTLQTGAANPFNGVDVGDFSTAAFADLDGDGDLDALIGETNGVLNYYRNTGTALAPVFTLQSGASNPFDGVDVGNGRAPTFVDLDGDGDLDAFIGRNDGIVLYARNTGTALTPVFAVQPAAANPFNGVDVGFFSTPSFADLDGDGDLDALIGEEDGVLNYYRNTGTALAPVFTLQSGAANPFNGVDIGLSSAPSFADLDGDGDLDAVIGESSGNLNYYRNTGSGFVLTVNVTAQNENPFTNGNDAVNLNTLLASGSYFLPDIINALDGDDNITLSNTVNVGLAFNGGIGNDTITGGTGNDIIFGQDGNDFLIGGAGNDQLFGGIGADILFHGEGADLFDGGGDIDYVTYAAASNVVLINLTNQALNAFSAQGDTYVDVEAFFLTGANDVFIGDTANNFVFAQGGNDTIVGGGGGDIIFGEGGNDHITSGALGDILSGGAGADTFAYTINQIEQDQILDFTVGEDKLAFDRGGFNLVNQQPFAGINFFSTTSAVGVSYAAGQSALIYFSDLGLLYADTDGAGGNAANLIAALSGPPNLSASDFIFT